MTGWDDIGLPGAAGVDPVMIGAEGPGTTGSGLLLDLGDETFGLPGSCVLPGEESVTLADETGMTICADTDGDGRVDTLSVVTFDGGWSSWRRQDCMDGSATVTEMDTDVSSVTAEGPGTGECMLDGGSAEQGEHAGELGRQAHGTHDVPPSTPGNGRGSWDARGWECVDRGNWG
ncbi:DUF6802 family protein [Corynebacterium glyciniphilum]|uniref:DUF6802 family protein n=1 Tax=Corynebacterium glyciniphilum TaxID=1404244 RepID=UPI001642795A|nr:DUF6802 family protein [Corynebacterium glyciniphilum]